MSKPNVLFVCVENSCRSQMAEGFARLLGPSSIEAFSAGSKPSGKINQTAIAAMREIGVDLTRQASKGLSELPARRWDYVITMGCGDACPFVDAVRREDWAIPDPKQMPLEEFRRVRDQIKERVKDLLEKLEASPSGKLSLVMPTYNESANLPSLVEKIFSVFKTSGIDGEIIVVDDGSPDGTGALADRLAQAHPALKVVHRPKRAGLSSAALAGFEVADGDVLGVMDADHSHPAEAIPGMLRAVRGACDIAIGTRYGSGGQIIGWNRKRTWISRLGTGAARLFTNVSDPLTGYFLIRKDRVADRRFVGDGCKILLEFLMETDCRRVAEIPIVFTNRVHGQSKTNARAMMAFALDLLRYARRGKFFRRCAIERPEP